MLAKAEEYGKEVIVDGCEGPGAASDCARRALGAAAHPKSTRTRRRLSEEGGSQDATNQGTAETPPSDDVLPDADDGQASGRGSGDARGGGASSGTSGAGAGGAGGGAGVDTDPGEDPVVMGSGDVATDKGAVDAETGTGGDVGGEDTLGDMEAGADGGSGRGSGSDIDNALVDGSGSGSGTGSSGHDSVDAGTGVVLGGGLEDVDSEGASSGAGQSEVETRHTAAASLGTVLADEPQGASAQAEPQPTSEPQPEPEPEPVSPGESVGAGGREQQEARLHNSTFGGGSEDAQHASPTGETDSVGPVESAAAVAESVQEEAEAVRRHNWTSLGVISGSDHDMGFATGTPSTTLLDDAQLLEASWWYVAVLQCVSWRMRNSHTHSHTHTHTHTHTHRPVPCCQAA